MDSMGSYAAEIAKVKEEEVIQISQQGGELAMVQLTPL